MQSIRIVGDIFSSSGYACHTRNLANALYEKGFDVSLECNKPADWLKYVNDAELNMLTKFFKEDMTIIMIGQPQFWPFFVAQKPKHFIGFVVWEGAHLPQYWKRYLNDPRVNQVWVPSHHVKNAVSELLADKSKLFVVPHGVNSLLFTPQQKAENEPFTFICNKGWAQGINDRGGVQWLLKAYCEEFSKADNVQLKLKINPTYNSPGWNWAEEIKKLGLEKRDDRPMLGVNAANLEPKLLPVTYAGDVFVCPTMCDGFNLPGLEAHSCGLPTIQTGFGGQKDYMTPETDFTIRYELVDVTWDLEHEGNRWAKLDIVHLRELMRWAYNNQEKIKQMGVKAREDALQHWQWSHSAAKAAKCLALLS